MPELIYLDNNATTRVADEVLAAMTPFYRDHFGNPHAIHSLGKRERGFHCAAGRPSNVSASEMPPRLETNCVETDDRGCL